MTFLLKRPYFFSKTMRGYESVNDPSARSSSDDTLSSSAALLEKGVPTRREKVPFWRKYAILITINSVIFVIYILVLLAVAKSARFQALKGPQLIASPAQSVVSWEKKVFVDNSQSHGPFTGKPREEVDHNWAELLNYENIIIEPEYMRAYGREDYGVAVPEGGGYIGTLNVYHQLHCLKRIYQYMYQEHYWTDLDDNQRDINRLHNEHCIDFLRQSVMCRGDIGLITFQWSEHSRIPVANATVHECINWDALDEWTKERTVDMMKPGWLIHPTKGPAYPMGEGSRLGAFKGRKPDSSLHLGTTHGEH